MAVWEYKVISSGKGGFATPALLESFLNQLGTEEWEIVDFRGQPDNPLAFSGLARRPAQRDWTLEDAAAAAARVEAEKLRVEFEAKFRSATAASAATPAEAPAEEAGREQDGLRRLRDTERDSDPDAPDVDAPEDEWDKLGAEDEMPTFFEAMRPHLRRNQRGPGLSVGVDYLAKKWDISEDDVIGALKECGLEIPDDENAKPAYVDYDGDLYWVNINRRGELWVNTKEKSRPVFRTVKASRVEPEEGAAAAEDAGDQGEAKQRPKRHDDEKDSGAPAATLPAGEALLERIRPHMRRNRRDPGGSGSVSFLSRALKCGETALVEAFIAMGLAPPGAAGDPPACMDIGNESWWLNKDQRGGIWINAREKRGAETPGARTRLLPMRLPPRQATCLPPSGSFSGRPKEEGSQRPWDASRAIWASRLTSCSAPSRHRGCGCRKGPRKTSVCRTRRRDFLAQPQRKGRALAERQGVKVFQRRRRGLGRERGSAFAPEDEGASERRSPAGSPAGTPPGTPPGTPSSTPLDSAGELNPAALRDGPLGADRAARADRVGQPRDYRNRLFPREARIRDAASPYERDGAVILRPPQQVALEHDGGDCAVAGSDPLCQVGGHGGLPFGILSAVAVTTVHHEVGGKPVPRKQLDGRKDVPVRVIRAVRPPAKHEMGVVVPRRLHAGRQTFARDRREPVRVPGRQNRVDGHLGAPVRSVLESDRHRKARGQLAVYLALDRAGPDGPPAHEVRIVLPERSVQELGRDWNAGDRDVRHELPCEPQSLVDVEGPVEVRVVDQALPADHRARLLEIDAHDDEKFARVPVRRLAQVGREFHRRRRVVDRARAHNQEQAVVRPRHDRRDVPPHAEDPDRFGFLKRERLLENHRGRKRPHRADAQVRGG